MYIKARDLSSVPVLGWEGSTCNSNNKRREVFRDDFTDFDEIVKAERKGMVLSNVGKVLGAFPLVTGQIIGATRIVSTILSDKRLYGGSRINKAKHIARGVSEFFGFGAAWFIFDALATVGRCFSQLTKGTKPWRPVF